MKKLLCVLLVLFMVLFAFTSCKTTDEDADTGTKTTETKTEEKTDTKTEETSPKEDVPKPDLKFLGRDATFDLAVEPIIPILEEITGYVVEYEALPAGDEGMNKLMLLLSSGESYDLMIINPSHFDRAFAANALIALDDMVGKAPSLMAAVPKESKSWERVTVDGTIYGIPQMLPTGGPVNGTIILRQDIMDDLGLVMPTNLDEFYNVLKSIKAAKPDMIPLSTQRSGFDLATIKSAFGLYEDWKDINGELVPVQKRLEYKEFIIYLRKLYEEKLLDEEFPANERGTKNEKFTSNVAAMVDYGWWEAPGIYAALKEELPEATTAFMPFLEDENGNAGIQVGLGLEKVSCISKSAEYPDDAIQWVESFMANFKQIYIGTEGIEHEYVDGKYLPIQPEFATRNNVWYFLPAVEETNVVDYWQARLRKNDDLVAGYIESSKLKEGINVVQPYFELYAPIEAMVEYEAVVGQFWKDEMIKIVVGARPLEYYEEVVAKWEADGGTEIIKAANENK